MPRGMHAKKKAAQLTRHPRRRCRALILDKGRRTSQQAFSKSTSTLGDARIGRRQCDGQPQRRNGLLLGRSLALRGFGDERQSIVSARRDIRLLEMDLWYVDNKIL